MRLLALLLVYKCCIAFIASHNVYKLLCRMSVLSEASLNSKDDWRFLKNRCSRERLSGFHHKWLTKKEKTILKENDRILKNSILGKNTTSTQDDLDEQFIHPPNCVLDTSYRTVDKSNMMATNSIFCISTFIP